MKHFPVGQARRRLTPYLFLLPYFVIFACFQLYPLLKSFVLSFHRTAGLGEAQWVGLGNYFFLLREPRFWQAVANTAGFTLAYLIVQLPLALGLATLLDSRRVRGRSLFHFAFFSTYLVGPVFVALIAGRLFERHGLINRLLSFTGIQPDWLNDPWLALPTTLLASVWLSTGFAVVYLLAAMRSIDPALVDAARVDGAGAWRRFWHITLPGVKPVLLFLIAVGTVMSLQLFELPYVLFQGAGPRGSALTIVMYLFLAFFSGDLGYASAVGWVLLFLIALTVLATAWIRRFADSERSTFYPARLKG